MTDFYCPVGDTLKIVAKIYESEARKFVYDLSEIDITFEATDESVDPEITLTKVVGDGILVPNPVKGELEITLTSTETQILGIYGGPLMYTLRVDNGIDIYTVAWGRIHLKRVP